MKRFVIQTLGSSPNPQQLCWLAMHQDHSADFVGETFANAPNEISAGKFVIKHCLAGDRGHYGILEHPQITLACGYFPHSVMQQLRTHRVGISFDVQSFRQSSEHILEVAEGKQEVEEVFYSRFSGESYREDFYQAALRYRDRIQAGIPAEVARDYLPSGYRQHFVLSCNARSLMHLLDLRWKANAQAECQKFSELLFEQFSFWMPQIAEWYLDSRAKKGRLAP